MLTLFKNALFASPLLEDNQILPISEWNKLQQQEMHDTLRNVDDLILSFIKVGDDKVNL
jgi:hypothetical protein